MKKSQYFNIIGGLALIVSFVADGYYQPVAAAVAVLFGAGAFIYMLIEAKYEL